MSLFVCLFVLSRNYFLFVRNLYSVISDPLYSLVHRKLSVR